MSGPKHTPTPGPWRIEGEAVEWHPRQKSPFDDCGASIVTEDETYVVQGGLQDEQGGAVGVLRMADAKLIAAAPRLAEALKDAEAAMRRVMNTRLDHDPAAFLELARAHDAARAALREAGVES